MRLGGKKIILGVSGSIAAYKSAELCRLLIKAGAEVRVVMTPAAGDFITPLTLSTLTNHTVYQSTHDGNNWSGHVELGLWADLMLIAPATANTLAHCAHGICDNMLDAVYLSAKCPVMIAPAMDLDMWAHPATKANIEILKNYGNQLINVGTGFLASGLNGPGRMAEPVEIVHHVEQFFSIEKDLDGVKVLITAGPTYEKIDPVRFIGNHSTGKMGLALAHACLKRGAQVHLVCGPIQLKIEEHANMIVHRVESAQEMYEACAGLFQSCRMAILAAAVADYRVQEIAKEKIKKSDQHLVINLTKTIDIAATLGQSKKEDQLLIGFALETENEVEHAKGKLVKKNFDMIVLNSLKDKGAGFGTDTNVTTLIGKHGIIVKTDLISKTDTAHVILNEAIKLM